MPFVLPDPEGLAPEVYPLAWLLGAPLGLAGAASLLPVIAGNVVGGSVFVALVYWIIYLRAAAGETVDRLGGNRTKLQP